MCLKFTLAPPLILKCKIETFLVESRFLMSGHVSGGDRHGPADRAHGAIRRDRDRTLFRGVSCVSIFAYIGKRKAVPLRGVYIALFKK